MGDIEVPADALWRAQTQRAVENFPISGATLEPAHVVAIARVKKAAARINAELGIISEDQAKAIAAGADEIIGGDHHDAFPIDVFQTGSGTSSNMNMNEVLASLASRHGTDCHPNDHVNASQSSNDTFPTSIHVAAVEATTNDLVPALEELATSLEGKAEEFKERGEVRSDAPDGRDSGDARPGVRRLRRDHPDGHRAAGVDAPPGGRAPAGRHRGRHRHQHPRRLRRAGHRRPRGGDRAAVHRGTQPLRGPGRSGRARRALRPAAHHRRRPHQDLQRPALDVERADDRARGDPPARPPAGVEHHARQGEPGAAGGDADGVRPGDRQRRHRRGRGRERQLRAQRDDAGDGPQPARVDPAARQRVARCSRTAASTASRPTRSGC